MVIAEVYVEVSDEERVDCAAGEAAEARLEESDCAATSACEVVVSVPSIMLEPSSSQSESNN